jgi:deazaflavin-dependent oxidoreductase (nitroreductase family)
MTLGVATAAFRHVNRFVEPVVKAGAASLFLVGPALVVLETVGRRSGKVRGVPVLAFRLGSKVFVSTVRGNSHWLANIDKNPSAAVWLAGNRRTGEATVHHEGFIDVASIEVQPAGEPPERAEFSRSP